MRASDLKDLRRADTILTELVRKGANVTEDPDVLAVVRRLFGWTGTLIRRASPTGRLRPNEPELQDLPVPEDVSADLKARFGYERPGR